MLENYLVGFTRCMCGYLRKRISSDIHLFPSCRLRPDHVSGDRAPENISRDQRPGVSGCAHSRGAAPLPRSPHQNVQIPWSPQRGVTFKWKDYRAKRRDRYQTMTLATPEFIRRFLIHVLPAGFHRIRHYGLLANHTRAKQLQRLRELLSESSDDAGTPATDVVLDHPATSTYTCPACGAPMIIIETFEKQIPRAPPADS